MTRLRVIAGNWKMHKGPSDARAFVEAFRPEVPDEGVLLLLFPPQLSVEAAVRARTSDLPLEIGVQHVHWEGEGAFTGEVSVAMAADAGASHALIGHSERRHLFGETDEEVGRKVAAVLRGGLRPVVCVGETIEERRAGRVEEVIVRQLDAALGAFEEAVPEAAGAAGGGGGAREGGGPGLVVAYEPVWAIGTGETATPDDAASAHGVLRRRIAERLGSERADGVPILYGGSVKPHNAAELLAASDVDGVLVGGASLDPDDFARIAEAAPNGAGNA